MRSASAFRPSSLPQQLDLLLVEGPKGNPTKQVFHGNDTAPAFTSATPAAIVQTPVPLSVREPSIGTAIFDLDIGTPCTPHDTKQSNGDITTAGIKMQTAAVTANRAAMIMQAMDRSLSDLDTYRQIKAACGLNTMDQLIRLLCPTTDIELAVAEHLKHVRSLPRALGMTTEDLAAELLAMGLLVQVRRGEGGAGEGGGGAGRNSRGCLRTLRHTFIVCTGYQRAPAGEDVLFKEPLVVEPRFKEQFLIAHPTPAYEDLLQVLPVSFVGSARRLEAAVRLLADEMALAFKQAGLSLPPWRSPEAMLSKWCPAQLAELSKLMRASAVQQQHQAAVRSSVLHPLQDSSAADAAAAVRSRTATQRLPTRESAPIQRSCGGYEAATTAAAARVSAFAQHAMVAVSSRLQLQQSDGGDTRVAEATTTTSGGSPSAVHKAGEMISNGTTSSAAAAFTASADVTRGSPTALTTATTGITATMPSVASSGQLKRGGSSISTLMSLHQLPGSSSIQPAVSEALDMVRSMSRQLSSTGQLAHSLPETDAARARSQSLRRSICGLQGAAGGGGGGGETGVLGILSPSHRASKGRQLDGVAEGPETPIRVETGVEAFGQTARKLDLDSAVCVSPTGQEHSNAGESQHSSERRASHRCRGSDAHAHGVPRISFDEVADLQMPAATSMTLNAPRRSEDNVITDLAISLQAPHQIHSHVQGVLAPGTVLSAVPLDGLQQLQANMHVSAVHNQGQGPHDHHHNNSQVCLEAQQQLTFAPTPILNRPMHAAVNGHTRTHAHTPPLQPGNNPVTVAMNGHAGIHLEEVVSPFESSLYSMISEQAKYKPPQQQPEQVTPQPVTPPYALPTVVVDTGDAMIPAMSAFATLQRATSPPSPVSPVPSSGGNALTDEEPLFTRQSSADLRRELQRERSRTKSALAAALKSKTSHTGPEPSCLSFNAAGTARVTYPSSMIHGAAQFNGRLSHPHPAIINVNGVQYTAQGTQALSRGQVLLPNALAPAIAPQARGAGVIVTSSGKVISEGGDALVPPPPAPPSARPPTGVGYGGVAPAGRVSQEGRVAMGSGMVMHGGGIQTAYGDVWPPKINKVKWGAAAAAGAGAKT